MTDDDRFGAAVKLTKAFAGEVRIPDAQAAKWRLTKVNAEERSASDALEKNKQFLLRQHPDDMAVNVPCCGLNWLSAASNAYIEQQCKSAARISGRDVNDYLPFWDKQTVRVACPTSACTGMEWRLMSDVIKTGLFEDGLAYAHDATLQYNMLYT